MWRSTERPVLICISSADAAVEQEEETDEELTRQVVCILREVFAQKPKCCRFLELMALSGIWGRYARTTVQSLYSVEK
jgi:hypothetical protein